MLRLQPFVRRLYIAVERWDRSVERRAALARGIDDPPEFVNIKLWDQSALVLTDWLLKLDETSLTYVHPGQKQALRDLYFALEFDAGRYAGLNYTSEDVAAAQERVARDMMDEDRAIE